LICKSKEHVLKLPLSFIEEFCDHIRVAWNGEIICTDKPAYDICMGLPLVKIKDLLDRSVAFRREVIKYILVNFEEDVATVKSEGLSS
jgi:hypothetical protein